MLRCRNCLTVNRVPREKLQSGPLCGNCKTVLDFPKEPLYARPESFDRDIAYWPETLLVEFTSAWCLYCKIFVPAVNELAAQHAGKLKVLRVDIDAYPDLAQPFSIAKTPTYIVYKNGTRVVRIDGAPKEKQEFVTWIENLINLQEY